jgi:protein-S-isoprenylcysteine O-methyltransferase Ste14
MSWRATDFEFRHRFWIISGTFCLGFSCYAWDHMNASVALTRMILGGLHSPLAGVWIRAILAAGVLLVTLAALVRSWAEAYLHSSVVHDSELHSDRLVADGPYRRVRNPLYLGNILLAVGMGPMASRTGFLFDSSEEFVGKLRFGELSK